MDVTTPETATCDHCGLPSVTMLLRNVCPWCGSRNQPTEDR